MKYYAPDTAKYTSDRFFNSLDLPTVFGIGFVPGKQESMAYYSSLYIEYRYRKTYGWFGLIGIDMHNHPYESIEMPDCNVISGERFGMNLMLGGGYRVPLVKHIRDFYQHPYLNKANLAFSAEIGPEGTYLKNVVVNEGGEPIMHKGKYSIENTPWHFYPVMKFNIVAEYFVVPRFCLFAMGSYLQQLIQQPWDNEGMRGTVSVSIGFASFFE